MRRAWALLLALLLSTLIGCFTERSVMRQDVHAPIGTPVGDDGVVVEIALLECPVNDAYINGSLWNLVDETPNPERKTALHENGFHMGIIGPVLPDRLIDLETSERNASNIHERTLAVSGPSPVLIGPNWKHCSYEIRQAGQPTPVELDKAQCVLELVAAPAKDGQITLAFTPLVQHGDLRMQPRAVHDPSGVLRWDLQANQTVERYDWLKWELTVSPNEYIVVGTQADLAGTLGFRSFLHGESLTPAQRLLLVRVIRGPRADAKVEGQKKGPMPLALQVLGAATRGKSP